MHNFSSILKAEILKGLPGTEIQWEMSSRDKNLMNFPDFPGENTRAAAVMILLYPYKDSIYTVFMQRPEYDGIHGGQISFPGGKKEHEDAGATQTALRETREETGVDQENISVIGTLTPLFIPVSNILVTPVVGWLEEKPEFKPKTDEVAFLIEADLQQFLLPSIIKTKPFEIRGHTLDVRYFDYQDHTIWGATAMILNELLTIIRRGALFHPE